jgi:hypothetical protein
MGDVPFLEWFSIQRASRLGGGFHLLEFVNLNRWNLGGPLKHTSPSCVEKDRTLRLCEEEIMQPKEREAIRPKT